MRQDRSPPDIEPKHLHRYPRGIVIIIQVVAAVVLLFVIIALEAGAAWIIDAGSRWVTDRVRTFQPFQRLRKNTTGSL